MSQVFITPFVPGLALNGALLPLATLNFYQVGTSVAAAVYADPDLNTSLGAVITADANGRFPALYLDDAITYRVILKTAADVTIGDEDLTNVWDDLAEDGAAARIGTSSGDDLQSVLDVASTNAADAVTAAEAAEASATAAATSAASAATAAEATAESLGILPAVRSSGGALPYTVTTLSITTAGAGSTSDGWYTGGVSGGPGGFAWSYQTTDGAVTAVRIDEGGLATANTAPTLSFPSGTFTTTPVVAVTVAVIPAGKKFWAYTSDYLKIACWTNSSSALTAVLGPDSAQLTQYLPSGVDAAVEAPTAVLYGYDFDLLTGSATTGPGQSDGGSTLVRNTLRVVATPQYDSTYTQLDFYCRNVGTSTAPELVCLTRNSLGTFDYLSGTGPLGAAISATGAYSRTFSFSVPGGGTAGDTVVCTYETGAFIAGDISATQTLAIADPTTASGVSFSNFNARPTILLTGTYSQVADKGAVKTSIAAGAIRDRNGIYNLNVGNTAKIRAALARVRNRTGSATVIACGDSITRGSHTGTNGVVGSFGYTGAYDRCFLAQLQTMLTGWYQAGGAGGLFLPTSYESIMGYGNIQGTYPAYNPRMTTLGDWAGYGVVPYTSIGGGFFRSLTAGGAQLSYTPATSVDTITLRYAMTSTSDSIRYRIDGGAWTTITTYSASNAYGSTDISVTLGSHTIEVQHLSGDEAYLHGILAYDSTTPAVRCINGGFSGSTAYVSWAQVIANPWSPGVLIGTEPADLKIIALGTNDFDDGWTAENFVTGMTTLITEARKLSDVVVLAPPPARTDNSSGTAAVGSGTPVANRSLDRQHAFNAALFDLCVSLNVPLIDQYGWFGEPATAVNIRGLSGGVITNPLIDDTLHPPYAGATIQALGLYEYCKAVC